MAWRIRARAEAGRVVRDPGIALDILRSRHSQFAPERQRFTKRRLVGGLKSAGFAVDRVTYCNSLLLPVSFTKFRIIEPLTSAKASSGVEPVSPWLDSLLHTPLRIEAAWIKAGGSFPLGQSMLAIGRKL